MMKTAATLAIPLLLLLLLLLLLTGCGGGSAGGPTVPDPPDPAEPEPAPDELVLLGWEPRVGDGYAAWGLTGENQPNGAQYRYRRHVPPGTPAFVERTVDGLELWLAERVEDGWVALYGSDRGDWRDVDAYRARLYTPDGGVRWDIGLNPFLARDRNVEIQDLRYDGGDLFFNEACATYSREAGGACSSLVRLDPVDRRLVWRTRDLVSNDIFLVRGPVLIAGYGFTAEPDSVFLVDRASGSILDAEPLDTAHAYMEMRNDTLHVVTRERVYRFALR